MRFDRAWGIAGVRVSVLSIRHLNKTFPGVHALIDVDFDVEPGEVHALVGQNGSGKSTLIKVLAGFHAPDSGFEAEVLGEAYALGDSKAAHDVGLRFVHQDLGLVPVLDSIDNLALGAGYVTGSSGRILWRQQAAAARRAVAAIGYDVDVRKPVDRLAPIERTAVAIARALRDVNDRAVALLVLDEPTATMPQPEVDRLFEIVNELRRRGIAVLYVSHHLEEIFTIGDRVTVLRDGRNVGTRAVAGLEERELVELMTGGFVDATVTSHQVVSDDPVLQARGLSGRRLRDVDLTVHRGEIVGVAGITGSGREELCSMLFGGRPRSGTVTVDGRPVAAMAPHEAVSAGVGFVPADRHRDGLIMQFNVRENLTLSGLGRFWKRLRLDQRDERRQCVASIGRLDVKTPSTETVVESLSGGNQQKIVLGKWLQTAPKLLLLDEPTQGVDIASKAELHDLIDRAAAAGSAVLVCSSDEVELERLCDRVVIARAGQFTNELRRPNISAGRLAQESLGIERPTVGTEGERP